ncbi:hypothetical protein DFH27DRAFT_529290 [Peziza echinospora]|nr:hypothetical protein DFH27DRAFT_529290 [Peziza echinospora]
MAGTVAMCSLRPHAQRPPRTRSTPPTSLPPRRPTVSMSTTIASITPNAILHTVSSTVSRKRPLPHDDERGTPLPPAPATAIKHDPRRRKRMATAHNMPEHSAAPARAASAPTDSGSTASASTAPVAATPPRGYPTCEPEDFSPAMAQEAFPTTRSLAVTLRYQPPPRPTCPAASAAAAENPVAAHYHYSPRTVEFQYHSFQTMLSRCFDIMPCFLTQAWKLHLRATFKRMWKTLRLQPDTAMRFSLVDGTEVDATMLFNEIERIIICGDEDGLFESNALEVVVRAEHPFL